MNAALSARAIAVVLVIALAACDAPEEGASDIVERSRALEARLAWLERRADLVRDVNDVKRLQRMYGYYLDEGLWDQAADLFSEDGTIEIGLDGVYVGRERVRRYLYALGGGRAGLPAGRLNEHMQVMPVVTVAPDGLTARARWREILMVGTYGESAAWGEGPMENEYVKEDGVWKIKSLHWFQNLFVPYEDGWLDTPDPTKGAHVSEQLPPDRPPSVAYETWPGVYMPPFHFSNPAPGAQSSAVIIRPTGEDTGVVTELYRPIGEHAPPSPDELARRAAVLAQEVAVYEAEDAIENLQRTFGFYFDESLWSEAASLFADEGTIELGAQGVYVGPARILAFLRTLGEEYPREGRLYDHMQLQPVVHVAPDGRSAKARWRLFSQVAESGEFAEWGAGVYENEYVLEDGVWKIASLRLYPTMRTPYELGWAVLAKPTPGPSEALPPDRPPSSQIVVYPGAFVAPFHYDHPVFGRPVYFDEPADLAASPLGEVDLDALEDAVDALAHRVTLLEDAEAVERLDTIRAYYLARSQWDDFAALFAPDGVIEIAMRGGYVGPESVRRSLELYTPPGIHQGLLHNHMMFQPVVHVAADGETAKLRARAFSIMGQFERYAQWMGGIYENAYVKRDGVWMIAHDQQINTYFVAYDAGWEDSDRRQPPGVSERIPPDLPPSIDFEMFPSAFLAPFHYPNPVTGEEVVVPEAE